MNNGQCYSRYANVAMLGIEPGCFLKVVFEADVLEQVQKSNFPCRFPTPLNEEIGPGTGSIFIRCECG